MKALWFAALAACAVSGLGIEVGTFSTYRLFAPQYNLVDGSFMGVYRNMWTSHGANFHQTDTLTPAFLSTVSVFVTSKIGTIDYTQDEVDALANWVRGGGTLVMMGECTCYGTHPMYNHLLAPFQISLSNADGYGDGAVLHQHALTQRLTEVYIAKNGRVAAPNEATQLLSDFQGYLASLVMEQTPLVGAGRLFLISDCDMFTDNYQNVETTSHDYALNIVAWATTTTGSTLTGTVTAEQYQGSLNGLPLTLNCYDNGTLTESKTATLDAQGHYSATMSGTGACTVVAKLPSYLTVRSDVVLAASTSLDLDFQFCGDASHDNAINLFDVNLVLVDFANTGVDDADVDGDGLVGLVDMNSVLINFGEVGQ